MIQDLPIVPQHFRPGRAVDFLRHYDRVAGHQLSAIKTTHQPPPGLTLAEHRAVGPEHIDVARVAELRYAACLPQVIGQPLFRSEDKSVLVIDGADDADHGRSGGNDKTIAVFQGEVREFRNAYRVVARQFEHNPAAGLELAQPCNQRLLCRGLRPKTRSLFRTHDILAAADRTALHFAL